MKSFHDMTVELDSRIIDYALDNRKDGLVLNFLRPQENY